MKFPEKIWLGCVVFFALLLTSFSLASSIMAADLTSAAIRLQRQASGETPTPILILVTPTSTAVEDGIDVTVGSAWNISPTASNYTVSTASLPPGVTAYPGIVTATGVSGSTVSFPGGNIAPGTLYGFYITGGITTNPAAGSGTGYQWYLATRSLGSTVDTAAPKVSVVSFDQIGVTATVAADTNDLSAQLTALTSGTTFSQDQDVVYEITYGSELAYSTNLTVQAEWSLGTISGQGTPSVEVVSYVNGSASTAYGGTTPVIDTVNRTITWSISNVPANTVGQTVQFTLETGGYTGTSSVNWTTAARITAPSSTADSEVTKTFQYDSPDENPATPEKKSCNELCSSDSECNSNYCRMDVGRCRNSENPHNDLCDGLGSTPGPTASPGSGQTAPTLISHQITSLSDAVVTMRAITSQDTSLFIRYGTAVNRLEERISSRSFDSEHLFQISNLLPNTQYFYQFEILTDQGSVFSSVYTFTTAEISSPAELDFGSTMLSIQGIPLFPDTGLGLGQIPIIVMPRNSTVDITAAFTNYEAIESVFIELRNTTVLGVNSNSNTHPNRWQLHEYSPGKYSGSVLAPDIAGWYDAYIEVNDVYGNITQTLIGRIHSTGSLQILNASTGKPIENAKVLFKVFNQRTQIFDIIKSGTFLTENPLFADKWGRINIVLPHGKYRAQVSADGYRTTNSDFIIGANETQVYPTIQLEPTSGMVTTYLKNQLNSALSTIDKLRLESSQLQSSRERFSTIAIILQVSIATASVIAFSAKSHIPLLQLPNYLYLHIRRLLGKSSSRKSVLHGLVTDRDTDKPITRANIVAIDKKDDAVIAHASTNKKGLFNIDVDRSTIEILVSAVGYAPLSQLFVMNSASNPHFELTKNSAHKDHGLQRVLYILQSIIGFFFEILVLLLLALQLYLIPQLGLGRVIPFLFIALLNVGLWAAYSFSQHSKK